MGVNPVVNTDIFNSVFRRQMKMAAYTHKLSGQITIAAAYPPILLLDPDGSPRDVLLPAEADSKDMMFYIYNTAGGTPEILTIKDDSDTDTILSLDQDEVGLVYCDGLKWRGFSGHSTAITATVAELNYLDIAVLGTGAASKAVVLDANGDYIWPAGQLKFQTETDAFIMGSGASGAHHALGVTAGIALEFRFTGTHTSGDMRGMYLRMNYEGIGGSGEALRVFSVLNNVQGAVGGTINGAHVTLDVRGASGSIDGQGNAIRATVGFDAAFVGGIAAIAGITIDTAIDAAATITNMNLSALRLATADSKKWPIFCAFDGVVGGGNAVEAITSNMGTQPTAWGIHVTVDGADGWIPVYDNNTWG